MDPILAQSPTVNIWSSAMTGTERAKPRAHGHVTDGTVADMIRQRVKSILRPSGKAPITNIGSMGAATITLERNDFLNRFAAVAVDLNAIDSGGHTSDGMVAFPLMIEGVVGGFGQLGVSFLKAGAALASHEMTLKMVDAKDLYDRYELATPTGTAVKDPNGRTEKISGTKTNDYTLFVHGWNMPTESRLQFAETMYKRMYWQGYQGDFGVFSWPTEWLASSNLLDMASPTNRLNFNRSELKAYQSGLALNATLSDLQGRTTHVLAHSMGAIVTSEALRIEAQKPPATRKVLADTVVMSQGAYTAHAYDGSAPMMWNPGDPNYEQFEWPNLYASRYAQIDQAVTPDKLFNFFNPQDGAVAEASAWPLNQATKADSFDAPYSGFTGPAEPYYDSETAEWRLINVWKRAAPEAYPDEPMHIVVDIADEARRREVLAFGLSAKAQGVGALVNVGGPFNKSGQINLSAPGTYGFNDSRADHSGQFHYSNFKRKAYWKAFLDKTGVEKWNV
jgi:pimeloyl-ACP methyl ester carboxylesterase